MLIYVSECINTFSMQKMSEYIFQKQNLFFGSFQSLKDSIFQITYLSNSLKCQNMYFKINIFVFRFLPNHQGLNLPNSKPSKTVHICIYRSQDLFAAITKLGITCQRRLQTSLFSSCSCHAEFLSATKEYFGHFIRNSFCSFLRYYAFQNAGAAIYCSSGKEVFLKFGENL